MNKNRAVNTEAYPLKGFLEAQPLKDGSRKSKTYFKEIARSKDLLAQDLDSLIRLGVRWPNNSETNIRSPKDYKETTTSKRYAETSFQRDIYKLKTASLSGDVPVTVSWVDLEVPVDYAHGVPRRACPDLVGFGDDAKTYIVDLKYCQKSGTKFSSTDTPIVGAYKSIYYAHCAKENAIKLRASNMFHKNANDDATSLPKIYNSPVAVLAANKDYWGFWERYLAEETSLAEHMKNISKISQIEFRAYQCDAESGNWIPKY